MMSLSQVSPGRPSLPLERILAVALEIATTEGADALTLRYLAKKLNSGTATLYRNFQSREDLVAQVVDQLFLKMEATMPDMVGLKWEEACRILATHMFKVLATHRGAARLLLESIPNGPSAMKQRERSFALFLSNGFSPSLAAKAYTTLARFVLGFAIQLSDQNDLSNGDPQQSNAFDNIDWTQFPSTLTVINEIPVPLEVEFSFGLNLMINGLVNLYKDELNQG
ncbi:TetR/AcrR family transcriptional regulator [Acinetobacter pittii]|jgi:AcrR family transcriptional regulator|nr:TetR/AcrR family transcriptional regulator [Acinetobacter pittii]